MPASSMSAPILSTPASSTLASSASTLPCLIASALPPCGQLQLLPLTCHAPVLASSAITFVSTRASMLLHSRLVHTIAHAHVRRATHLAMHSGGASSEKLAALHRPSSIGPIVTDCPLRLHTWQRRAHGHGLCYTINAMCFFACAAPTTVQSAMHILAVPQVDHTTTATFTLPGDATGTIQCNFGVPPTLGLSLLPCIPELHVAISAPGTMGLCVGSTQWWVRLKRTPSPASGLCVLPLRAKGLCIPPAPSRPWRHACTE
ncbi:hypothetical protein DFH09DRAFT_1370271 [Mycena vulgaris]|nr:hypothetical protein DFH09DRAFT_1370271 [Mycena vulgaris]